MAGKRNLARAFSFWVCQCMRSKTRAVENLIMTSRLVNIRLGDICYVHV